MAARTMLTCTMLRCFRSSFFENTSGLCSCLPRSRSFFQAGMPLKSFTTTGVAPVARPITRFSTLVFRLDKGTLYGNIRLPILSNSRFPQSLNINRSCSGQLPGASKLGKIYSDKMQIVFTCNVCQERSSRVISKQAYTKGVVIVRCYGCNNNHLIADNLGWFFDEPRLVKIIAALVLLT